MSQHDKAGEWPNLSRPVHVHKEVAGTKSGNISHSDRLYISDLHGGYRSYYAKVIRGHWAVENLLHRVKDVQHGEDENGISVYNAAMNVFTLGSMALNLHRNNGRAKIKGAQLFAASNCREMVCEIRT